VTHIVYTLGYSGRKMDEIEALVAEREAILFDVRFSPRSRDPVWSGSSLRRVFGQRYRHIRAFGNRNYRDGPIEIVDFEAGVEAIRRSGRPVILMCGCRDYRTCHRRHVAEQLRVLGFTVEEISSAGRSKREPGHRQPRLF